MWECGLKHNTSIEFVLQIVTPYVGVWIETRGGGSEARPGSHSLCGSVD